MNDITFSDEARRMVLSFIDENDSSDEALRISVSGSPASPRFDLTLVPRSERTEDEVELDQDGFAVLLKREDAETLEGATVDFVERVKESGFEVRTARDTLPHPETSTAGPVGEIAERVRDVLESQVNPAIATHGGMISLVDVKETDVYVEMSGGCQGCALSRMTLRQGVERMLREAVPELTAVHDVTDHASGDNPYL